MIWHPRLDQLIQSNLVYIVAASYVTYIADGKTKASDYLTQKPNSRTFGMTNFFLNTSVTK